MARRPACNQEVEVSTQARERVGMCVCRVEVECGRKVFKQTGASGWATGRGTGEVGRSAGTPGLSRDCRLTGLGREPGAG